MENKSTAELIEEAREKYEKACAMVSALCKRKGEPGAREWIMSIPARPDHDPDIVISDALHTIQYLADRLEVVERVLPRVYEYHQEHEATKTRLAEAERVIDNMRAKRAATIFIEKADHVLDFFSEADAYRAKYPKGALYS